MTVFQRIGDTTRTVVTGDILVNHMGKTFIFTGTDNRGNLQLTSTCDRRYFITASPGDYNCFIGSSPSQSNKTAQRGNVQERRG